MTETNPAVTQLADEIHTVVMRLHTLGLRVIDPLDDRTVRDIERSAVMMVSELDQEAGNRLAAKTAADVMRCIWPHISPEAIGRAEWWATPLGTLMARALGSTDDESVSRSTAAAMLGVHPGTVAQLVHRGTLERHPEGGVLRASVLQRLAR